MVGSLKSDHISGGQHKEESSVLFPVLRQHSMMSLTFAYMGLVSFVPLRSSHTLSDKTGLTTDTEIAEYTVSSEFQSVAREACLSENIMHSCVVGFTSTVNLDRIRKKQHYTKNKDMLEQKKDSLVDLCHENKQLS